MGDEGRAAPPLAGVVVRVAVGLATLLAGVARLPGDPVALDVLLVALAVLAGLAVLAVELRGGVLLLELLGAAVLLALRAGRAAALLDDGRDAGAADPVVSKDSLSKSKNPMLFLPRQYGCTRKNRLCDTVRRRAAIDTDMSERGIDIAITESVWWKTKT